ncbi:hypothetical protein [Pedobacter metabolipauper]|uniref:Uncharacterized protein n=1 Tax=Pedobacter metabolipauper TaxID=425513 RepID=A0A4R6SYX8_9SPHI|nr:hypothetical protein [Pedobacter metabolipauper]TDQ09922.1 hypothetical protein ATK78_2081 [Pedobacter metabolipauper]
MNLFFLNNSVYQIYLARELMFQYQIEPDDCTLVLRLTENHTSTLRTSPRSKPEILKIVDWNNIFFLGSRKSNSFFKRITNALDYEKKCLEIFHSYPKVGKVIFGNYGNESMRNLANKLIRLNVEVFFLDEGIGTLHLYQSREKNATGTLKKSMFYSLKYLFTSRLKDMIFKLKTGDVRGRVHFFTEYKLDSTDKTQIITNEYNYFKKLIENTVKTNESYFVGTPYVNKGRIALNTYIDIIKSFKNLNASAKIKYIPHPREDSAILKDELSALDIEILNISTPIEIYLMNLKQVPAHIGGFTSTSLHTIYSLFSHSCNFTIFKLPDAVINKNERFIFNYFKNEKKGSNFNFIESV